MTLCRSISASESITNSLKTALPFAYSTFAYFLHELVFEQIPGFWSFLRVNRQTLLNEILEFRGTLFWVRESLGRMVLDHEHRSHRVDVAERRFSLGQFDARNTQGPNVWV